MRLRTMLAASTALAIVAAAPGAQANDLYVSVFGGANFLQDESGAITSDSDYEGPWSSDASTGFTIGGAIGTHLDKWAQGLRAEVEVAYRRNDLGGAWSENSGAETGTVSGNLSTFSILANVWYDFDIGTKAVPYVGGGIGWGRMKGEWAQLGDETSTTAQEKSGFAWQLGAGFNYPVAPDITAGLGYRYVAAPKFEVTFDDDGHTGDLSNGNHVVQFNLTIGIN